MTPPDVAQLSASRDSEPLQRFTQEIFAALPRADQRQWAHIYTRALLTAPGRKSGRNLADSVGMPEAAHNFHQFVNASPWDWLPVRRSLLQWGEERDRIRAWVVGMATVARRGEHCAGVHQRFLPERGRTVNCQAGIGMFLAGRQAHMPVAWRLLLPGRWAQDEGLRARTRIPAAVRDTTLVGHVLELVDSLVADSGSAPRPLVTDLSHEQGVGWLLRTLRARHYDFVVAVPDSLPARTRSGPVLGARRLLGLEGTVEDPVGRGGIRMRSRSVGLPGVAAGLPECRLFSVSAPDQQDRLWITNLVEETPEKLYRLSRHADASSAMKALTDEFGMAAFEGRSYPGWHHHMTLLSAAYAFSRLGGADSRLHVPAARRAA
ncbi:transposase [Streptomyces kanamyceticus]|uniref:IS701 family transposase n=1 Tax=Streptomyces kanamyceticus TaxID=1967 RepID=UPI0037DCBBDD